MRAPAPGRRLAGSACGNRGSAYTGLAPRAAAITKRNRASAATGTADLASRSEAAQKMNLATFERLPNAHSKLQKPPTAPASPRHGGCRD